VPALAQVVREVGLPGGGPHALIVGIGARISSRGEDFGVGRRGEAGASLERRCAVRIDTVLAGRAVRVRDALAEAFAARAGHQVAEARRAVLAVALLLLDTARGARSDAEALVPALVQVAREVGLPR